MFPRLHISKGKAPTSLWQKGPQSVHLHQLLSSGKEDKQDSKEIPQNTLKTKQKLIWGHGTDNTDKWETISRRLEWGGGQTRSVEAHVLIIHTHIHSHVHTHTHTSVPPTAQPLLEWQR